MKFKTIQEAFNHYRTSTAAEIETRAADIKQEINTDPNADVDSLNIELDGLKQAKENIEERSSNGINQNFNPITGMSFESNTRISDSDILSSREYRSAFHKTMMNQTLSSEESSIYLRANAQAAAETRAAFINTSEAAAVIPTPIINEIYKYATDMGGVLPLVRRFDIPSNVAVPVATPEEAAEWHVEGVEVTPDNKKPTNVIFNAYELMKVFSMSAAARQMSITAFESYLREELQRVMVVALQKAVIDGTGSGQPLGLLTPGVIKNELLNQPAGYDSFTKALAKLKRGYAMGAVWAMNNTTLYDRAIAVADAVGRPLFNNPNDGDISRILGKSITVDDFIPDDTIILGNFKYYAMNYPQNIMLEVSRESSFRKGLIDYRAMAIADGKPIISEAFVKMTLK